MKTRNIGDLEVSDHLKRTSVNYKYREHNSLIDKGFFQLAILL